jgi:uncharacterized protein (TIGR03083 family)
VADVYLHKAACIRDGVEPEDWPPPWGDEPTLVRFDRALAELRPELAERPLDASTGGWFKPDRTVGFWVRRMAQETVVHRVDAELAAGLPVSPIPADLAVDGVDELLALFLPYAVDAWGDSFADILDASPGRRLLLKTDGASWLVSTGPGAVAVCRDPGQPDTSVDAVADATVSGSPEALLRWVWNRETPGAPSGTTVSGDGAAVDELRRCLVVAAQ